MKDGHSQENLTTEEASQRDINLLERAQIGDDKAVEALLEAYKPLVLSRASRYYLTGQDRDDLIQEGMIALFSAVLRCPAERYASFSSYAFQAVDNRLIDLVRQNNSQKMQVILEALSLDADLKPGKLNSDLSLADIVRSEDIGPDHQIILKETRQRLYTWIQEKLSPREREVLMAFASGDSYKDIAQDLDISVKGVDSALQRARSKLRNFQKQEKKEES